MRFVALALMILLAACSPQQQKAGADRMPASAQASPTAAPSPNATPINCQDERNGGYGNAKECYYATCKKGDAEACRMAESYNGNLFPADGADPPEGLPLEEMTYLDARKVILGKGWVPLEGPCSGFTADDVCSAFPEVGYCQGTGLAHCDMSFRRGTRCLVVVTTGGYPDSGYPEDSLVEWVRIHDGPCKKDPNDP